MYAHAHVCVFAIKLCCIRARVHNTYYIIHIYVYKDTSRELNPKGRTA